MGPGIALFWLMKGSGFLIPVEVWRCGGWGGLLEHKTGGTESYASGTRNAYCVHP